MTQLADRLRDQISATGPLPLDRFMASCLGDPEHGYYTTRDPLGAAGDFTTAPEISQMFGEMIGLMLAQIWVDQGRPAPVRLVELGPGRGTLMADLLRTWRAVPDLLAAVQITLVEQSAPLRAIQAETISHPGLSWVDQVSDIPRDAPWLVVANEFFDALPIRQFQRQGQAWAERLVTLDDDALTLTWGPSTRQQALAHRLADTAEGAIVELCPSAQQIMARMSGHIADHGGAIVIADYGDWGSLGDTLQAVANHAPTDPLAAPGAADLTAHVDFAALTRAACPPLQATHMRPQGEVLDRLGIVARAAALAGPEGTERHSAVAGQLHRLTHPSEMGTLFKMLALTPVGSPTPPGFSAP